MPGDAYLRVHEIALDQHGYFTTEQADEAGVGRTTLAAMCKRGTIDRMAHGLYFDTLVPASPMGPYMAATLWPRSARGVISHQTALTLLELSDINPDKIHLTVSPEFRIRRATPRQYTIHPQQLTPSEITSVEGVPVTSAIRAIRDCYESHVGAALLRQAIEDGRRTGRLSAAEANLLESEVLTGEQSAEHA